MTPSKSEPTFTSRVAHRDQQAALEWLERAFGFETVVKATTPDGKVVHAQVRFGNGRIQIGSEWNDMKAPGSVGGADTQTLCIHLEEGIDAHCERTRAAGGRILQEPQDQFHGDRTYRVVDPEGHIWTVSQKLRKVAIEEMEAAIPGMKVWTAPGF